MTQPEKIVFRPIHDHLGTKKNVLYVQGMIQILSYGVPRADGSLYHPKVTADLYYMQQVNEN